MTPLHFHKYHGLGNDYLVCHRDVAEQLSNEHIQMLCHRHYGVGSDGLLIDSGDQINPTLRIINPDGSEAEKSGNGLRIYARYLFDIGRVGHEPFLVHTAGGDVYCTVHGDVHQISVDMGRANFNPAALPALVNLPEAVNYPLPLADETLSVVLVSMGNPHCVVLVDKLDLAQVHRLGPQIEGKVDDRVDVNMPGGQLHITFDADFQVRMRGPVHKIASLTLDKDCFVGGSAIFTGAA